MKLNILPVQGYEQPYSLVNKLEDENRSRLTKIIDIDTSVLKLIPGFDIIKARMGYYSAKYFQRTSDIVSDLAEEDQQVTMQVFQKTEGAVVCGINLIINLLKLLVGEYKNKALAKKLYEQYIEIEEKANIANQIGDIDNYLILISQLSGIRKNLDILWELAGDEVLVQSLVNDGDLLKRYQPVIKIKGPYKYFAIAESIYLGFLARATKIATNAKLVVEAANGKPVLFFADRFDNVITQQLDGHAAIIGGCSGVATDAHGTYHGRLGTGTMPHALIASFNGDTSKATLEFARKFPDVPLISLVDFHNNCAKTSVEVGLYLRSFGKELYGVRLDTSGTIVDEGILLMNGYLEKYFTEQESNQIRQEYLINKSDNNIVNNSLFSESTLRKLKDKGLTGVSPDLVRLVRLELDKNGLQNVKIGVSGGFNVNKIRLFESLGVPVDFYGSGSGLLTGNALVDNGDFTADIVQLNGKPISKVGRKEF